MNGYALLDILCDCEAEIALAGKPRRAPILQVEGVAEWMNQWVAELGYREGEWIRLNSAR